MTLILLCLSALTAFLSAQSNATKLLGWQPAVICRAPNASRHDTPIMDLCVLLNKWLNDCHDGSNRPHFYSSRTVQSNAAGQDWCNCGSINKRWICVDDKLMESYGTLLECMHLKGRLLWRAANTCSIRRTKDTDTKTLLLLVGFSLRTLLSSG